MIGPFTGEYAYLSNFYRAPFSFQGVTFPTVEHFYQMCKTSDMESITAILNAPTPAEAKRLGRAVRMEPGFDGSKRVFMLTGVLAKFSQNPDLRAKLDATGYEHLVEVNTWGDRYWGQVNGQGQNWLGRILMMVREVTRP